jgi:hypothetical protein
MTPDSSTGQHLSSAQGPCSQAGAPTIAQSSSTQNTFPQTTVASSQTQITPLQNLSSSTQAQTTPVQTGQQQPQNFGAQSSHSHKTHLPHILNKIKSLPLKLKLSMNKNIEQQNEQRVLRAYNHALDPVNNSDPGSEAASLITISSEEMLSLHVPSVMSSLSSVMPLYLLRLIGLKDKHRRDDHEISAELPLGDSKRRCMDGSKLIPRSAANAVEIAFPQILFDTELEVAVPLSFFTHSNLRYIIDHASTLPTKRANGKSDGKKGPVIIDVEKLAEKLGRELSIDYGQYTQASHQFYRFQSLRDAVTDGSWTKCWYLHFQFFESRHDAEEFYPYWKESELQLRRDRRSLLLDYNENQYDLLYSQAKNNATLLKLIQDRDIKPRYDAARRFTPKRFEDYPRKSEDSSRKPFPAGGGKSTASLTCILCAERGHSVFSHPSSQTKFPDGKSLWAKIVNNRPCTPDNRDICINFNLGLQRTCTHGAERAHICSFCGSKGHHALSWTCRSGPN